MPPTRRRNLQCRAGTAPRLARLTGVVVSGDPWDAAGGGLGTLKTGLTLTVPRPSIPSTRLCGECFRPGDLSPTHLPSGLCVERTLAGNVQATRRARALRCYYSEAQRRSLWSMHVYPASEFGLWECSV